MGKTLFVILLTYFKINGKIYHIEKTKEEAKKMEVQKNSLTKLCSFYVSDWHLVTMLLPYINQKINEKAKIATILEEDIEKNIITLVERLNLKNKEQILNVNWKKQEKVGIKNEIRINELEENEELIILVNGRKEFIEKNNIKLARYFDTHLIKNNIKIIWESLIILK